MNHIRRQSHAGSWYSSNRSSLDRELSGWLADAEAKHGPAKAIIAPHAGYSYSGPCAAWAYKQIDPKRVKTIFVLGPSHRVSLQSAAVTCADEFETPLGNLKVNKSIVNELLRSKKFQQLQIDQEEDEHSIEMHLPFIAKVMQGEVFDIVPIIIGSANAGKEQEYGKIFAPYLLDPSICFVVSSDFCHWGKRFGYFHQSRGGSDVEIWQGIEQLDKRGMELIEQLDTSRYYDYLNETRNTICGRHPIGVLLQTIDICRTSSQNGHRYELKFVKYDQSNKCRSEQDSSVSYASAALVIKL